MRGLVLPRWRRLFQRKRPLLEVHVPISPTGNFFTMVRYLATSLRLNGGDVADSRVIVTVGADQPPENLYARLPWSEALGIEWRWLDRALFVKHSYFATALERFRYRYRSRLVMLLDADVFVAAPFTDILEEVARDGCLGGLVAHLSPFLSSAGASSPDWWRRLFSEAKLGPPEFAFEHTGWEIMYRAPEEARRCPAYFNLGVLIAPARVMNAIGETVSDEMEAVNRVLQTDYRCQLALSLALARHRVCPRALPMRYNFPNDDAFGLAYPADMKDVRLFHYLRAGSVMKSRDFDGLDRVDELVRRKGLGGVNEMMQRALRPIHERVLASRLREASQGHQND